MNTRVPFETMYAEFLRVLSAVDFAPGRAEICARLFAENSRDGVASHGLNRFPTFIEAVKKRLIDPMAEPIRIQSHASYEAWDGQLGAGNLNAFDCMGRAIRLAKQGGLGCVALRNTNHWMRGGTYGWQAAEAGCIGICWTNAYPSMPPWGAAERRLGNNPLVLAVPHEAGHVVVDFAQTYEDTAVEGAQVAEREGQRVVYQFERGNITASELIGRLSARYRIRDLSVHEPDIEATIRRIY